MWKQLPPSSWYTYCLYRKWSVSILNEEQMKTVHLKAATDRYTKCCIETSYDELHWNWARNTDFYLYPKVTEILQVWEHCTDKSYTEFDRNWARNVENMWKYQLTQMSELQLSRNLFWSTSHELKTTVWRNHTPSDWHRAR